MTDFTGARAAIVTGTSAGIGEAVARQLLERGWTVLGIARRRAPIDHAAYRHVSFDLAEVARDASAVRTELDGWVRSAAPARLGLVNNAAMAEGLMPLGDLEADLLARAYAVNLLAPVWLMGVADRSAASRRIPLRVVNVSSGAATTGFPGLAAYGSAKAGLRLAGMSLAAEWGAPADRSMPGRDAAILSYEPGVVETHMQHYARSRPPEVFPWVGMFLEFQRRGVLVPPDRPAAEIAEFLETDGQPPFAERRLRT